MLVSLVLVSSLVVSDINDATGDGKCYEGDDHRHALGVVVSGSSDAAINEGINMVALASNVLIQQFNLQLELVGTERDVDRPTCMNGDQGSVDLLRLPTTNRESFGGIHVHMVDHCPEPSKWGGFVLSSDRICSGHTALYYGRSDYVTLIHEIGHLMSASHPGDAVTPICSRGGIMDYCNGNPHPYGTYDGHIQFHPESHDTICNELNMAPCLYKPNTIQPHEAVHANDHLLFIVFGVATGLATVALILVCFLYFPADQKTPLLL